MMVNVGQSFKIFMIYLIIIGAIVIRFVIHFTAMDMANFAPITALAIFGAAYLPKKQAIVIPLAARLISDFFIGFFQWPLMVAVYACHLFGILLGLWIRRSAGPCPALKAGRGPALQGQIYNQWIKIVSSSLIASVVFFIVTNFAFFYPTYQHNFTGIIQAYANGIPFFRGTLFGDLFYTVALFGGYAFAKYIESTKKTNQRITTNITNS
jgi:hypothetical protein